MNEEHPLYKQLTGNITLALAQQVKSIVSKRDDEPIDVCRFHRDLADDVIEAILPELNRMILAEEILGSEPFLWLMCGSDYNDTHLDSLRPAFKAWVEKGGRTWGKP